MTYITHAIGGAIAGSAMISASGINDKIAMATMMSGAVLGSLLPDIDHTKSKISKSSAATQVASYAVAAVTKHRGFLHTPLFILITAIVLGMGIELGLEGQIHFFTGLAFLGLIPGMLSHLVLDTCNPGGIMWLYPLKRTRFSILPIKTSSLGEMVAAIVLGGVLALMYGVDIQQIIRR